MGNTINFFKERCSGPVICISILLGYLNFVYSDTFDKNIFFEIPSPGSTGLTIRNNTEAIDKYLNGLNSVSEGDCGTAIEKFNSAVSLDRARVNKGIYWDAISNCYQKLDLKDKAIEAAKNSAEYGNIHSIRYLKNNRMDFFPNDRTWISLGFSDAPAVTGVEFGIDSPYVRGLQLGPFISSSIDAKGVQLALLRSTAENIDGIQIALFNNYQFTKPEYYSSVSGLQVGLINYSARIRGIQLGLHNSSNYGAGIQIGFVNINTINFPAPGWVPQDQIENWKKDRKFKGLQLGIFNAADSLEGIQIGLLNLIKHSNGSYRSLPIFNASW